MERLQQQAEEQEAEEEEEEEAEEETAEEEEEGGREPELDGDVLLDDMIPGIFCCKQSFKGKHSTMT